MKKIFHVLGLTLIISFVFLVFNPQLSIIDLIDQVWDSGQFVKSFEAYLKKISDPKPVVRTLQNLYKDKGIKKSLALLCIGAPLKEEFLFRMMPLLFFIIFGTKNGERRAVAWIILVLSTHYWTCYHYYPPLYQAIVFQGGLINGSCIIYFSDKKIWGFLRIYKWLGALTAILLHSAANAFYFALINLLF